jgi:hypothetical protein
MIQPPVRPAALTPDDRCHDLGVAGHPGVPSQAVDHLLEGRRLLGKAAKNPGAEGIRLERTHAQKGEMNRTVSPPSILLDRGKSVQISTSAVTLPMRRCCA